MKRLTTRDDRNEYDVYKGSYKDIECNGETIINVMCAYRKLGKLEDLEEELGIDLITLLKALKDGAYIKGYSSKKNLCYRINYRDEGVLYLCPIDIYDDYVYVTDYGKTWSLVEEELR